MTGQGFADDCGPMIGGDNTHDMYKSMQRMLNKLYHWGEGKNLKLRLPYSGEEFCQPPFTFLLPWQADIFTYFPNQGLP